MTHNILTAIESVRKHLDKLDEEREGLPDLVKKLEEIQDSMTALLAVAGKQQGETEEWSNGLQTTITRFDSEIAAMKQELQNLLHSFQNDSQETLQAAAELLAQYKNDITALVEETRSKFDQVVRQLNLEFQAKSQSIEGLNSDFAQSVENKVRAKIEEMEALVTSYKQASIEPAQSLAEKVNNAIAELHKAFNLRANQLDERLAKFSRAHSENLEQINKVYQQIYVAYEKLQSSVDAMEISLESKTQIVERKSGEIAEIIQAERENNEARIAAITDSLKSSTEDSFGKFQEEMQGKMEELGMRDAELQDLLQSRDLAVHARMQQMWLGVLLSAIISSRHSY
jgi:ABC-type transporter Mla subunit MlaD